MTPDPATLVLTLTAPAKAGDPDAAFALGLACEMGLGLPEDLHRARAWYHLAAASSLRAPHPVRRSLRCRSHQPWHQVVGPMSRALARAAREADPYAQQFPQAPDAWRRWYGRHEVAAPARAEFALARLLQKSDDPACLCWYRRAAEGGLVEAQIHLGLFHRASHGPDCGTSRRFLAQARRALRRLASPGNPEASYRLGVLEAEGWGGPTEPARARRHLRQAAEAGHEESWRRLARLAPESSLMGPPRPAPLPELRA